MKYGPLINTSKLSVLTYVVEFSKVPEYRTIAQKNTEEDF